MKRLSLTLALPLLLLARGPGAFAQSVAGTPWQGSRDMGTHPPPAGAAAHGTNNIYIEFHPELSERVTPCAEITIIQTTQPLFNGVSIDPGTESSQYGFQNPDAIGDLPGTPEDERGTSVDAVATDTTPYYPDTGRDGHTGHSATGDNDTTTMSDTPRSDAGDRGFGGPTGVDTITYKFEDCAFCRKGEDVGKYFDCMTWVYERTAAEAAAGTPGTSKITGTYSMPTKGFQAAADQWSANHDFDLPH